MKAIPRTKRLICQRRKICFSGSRRDSGTCHFQTSEPKSDLFNASGANFRRLLEILPGLFGPRLHDEDIHLASSPPRTRHRLHLLVHLDFPFPLQHSHPSMSLPNERRSRKNDNSFEWHETAVKICVGSKTQEAAVLLDFLYK
jgi:hypothetical protein